MSVAPHSGIVDFGTFTPPVPPINGIQGEVPAPLATEDGYVLSTNGWVPQTGGVSNLDGGMAASTYGAVSPIDGGGA